MLRRLGLDDEADDLLLLLSLLHSFLQHPPPLTPPGSESIFFRFDGFPGWGNDNFHCCNQTNVVAEQWAEFGLAESTIRNQGELEAYVPGGD